MGRVALLLLGLVLEAAAPSFLRGLTFAALVVGAAVAGGFFFAKVASLWSDGGSRL